MHRYILSTSQPLGRSVGSRGSRDYGADGGRDGDSDAVIHRPGIVERLPREVFRREAMEALRTRRDVSITLEPF